MRILPAGYLPVAQEVLSTFCTSYKENWKAVYSVETVEEDRF
jgi:hypothetical protein